MKTTILVVAMLAIVGCSNAPTKLERIEANEAAITDLQSKVDANSKAIEINKTMGGNLNTKIDRMFEKAMYK